MILSCDCFVNLAISFVISSTVSCSNFHCVRVKTCFVAVPSFVWSDGARCLARDGVPSQMVTPQIWPKVGRNSGSQKVNNQFLYTSPVSPKEAWKTEISRENDSENTKRLLGPRFLALVSLLLLLLFVLMFFMFVLLFCFFWCFC